MAVLCWDPRGRILAHEFVNNYHGILIGSMISTLSCLLVPNSSMTRFDGKDVLCASSDVGRITDPPSLPLGSSSSSQQGHSARIRKAPRLGSFLAWEMSDKWSESLTAYRPSPQAAIGSLLCPAQDSLGAVGTKAQPDATQDGAKLCTPYTHKLNGPCATRFLWICRGRRAGGKSQWSGGWMKMMGIRWRRFKDRSLFAVLHQPLPPDLVAGRNRLRIALCRW
jgi:hypothetical protein